MNAIKLVKTRKCEACDYIELKNGNQIVLPRDMCDDNIEYQIEGYIHTLILSGIEHTLETISEDFECPRCGNLVDY